MLLCQVSIQEIIKQSNATQCSSVPKSPLISKISVLQNSWSYECPKVYCPCQPAGDDLDPHGGRVAGVAGQVPGRGVPVGQGHHHVQRGQGEHHVEYGPAVCNLEIMIQL